MKKVFSLFSLIATLCICVTFISCTPDEDVEEAMVLRGEWSGEWKMYYTTHLGHTFYAYNTDIVFYTNNNYTNHGYGYQVDFYDYGPYTEIYSRFTWSIDNGVIYIDYPDDHRYDTTIYEYRLNDRHFTGYLGNSDQRFVLVKLVSFDWSYYYDYGDYYYWSDPYYIWDSGDYYYYAKTRGTTLVENSDSTSTPNEPERIVKIGSLFTEK